MNWIRSKVRPAAHLALVALALQLVVSFGHVHVDKLRLVSAASAASAATAATAVVKGDLARKPGVPPGQHNPDDDFCAICASIALAGSLVVPATPALTLPPPVERVWLRQADARQALGPPRLSFQARAPPV
jgi:hypothetical protein